MSSKLSLIIQKSTVTFGKVFSYFGEKRRKKDAINEKQDKNSIAVLSKCYYCEGTGSIRSPKSLEDNLPSRFGSLNTNPMVTCPLCKGTGYINTPSPQ